MTMPAQAVTEPAAGSGASAPNDTAVVIKYLKPTKLPPYDATLEAVFKLAFPPEVISKRVFERPQSWAPAAYSFANHNEDSNAEIKVVQALAQRASRPLDAAQGRVMCVASAGETATALAALPGVLQVDAVDMNPSQCQLTLLRYFAMLHLSNDNYRALFGLDVDSETSRQATEQQRVRIYESFRGKLPEGCRAFFDAVKDTDIAFGLALTGKAEQWGNACMRSVLATTGEANIWDPRFWVPFADVDTLMTHMAFPAAWMSAILPKFSTDPHAAGMARYTSLAYQAAKTAAAQGASEKEVLADAAARLRRNFFMQLLLTGAAGCGADVPDCYSPAVQLQLQDKVAAGEGKLEVHVGNIFPTAAELAKSHSPFAFITLSNVLEFSPTFEAAVAAVKGLLTSGAIVEGGAVMLRTCMGVHSAGDVLEAAGLQLDAELCQLARKAERSVGFGGDWAMAVGVLASAANGAA